MTTCFTKMRAFTRLGRAMMVAGLLVATLSPASAATPVQKVTSPGGLEAWLIESHEIGIVSMRVLFEGGAMTEPADKLGVAQVTAYMFNEGAGAMDTAELSSQRQRIGVAFGGSVDYTGLTISFSAPSIHKKAGFDLLRAAFHQPRYDVEPIERARREYEAALTAELQSPGSIASNKLRARYFAGQRMATSIYGTLDSLKQITAADIEAYRRRTFGRSNLKIAVAGDITPAELGPLLDDLFANLPATIQLPATPDLVPQSASADVVRMEIPQALVLTGNVAARLKWRQAMAYDIANQVLSGDATGRLFREVREQRGLVYSIQASRYDMAGASIFVTGFGAGSDNVSAALEETRHQIDRFLSEGPTEEEIASAKSAFLGSFFLGLDTNDKLVAQVMWMLREGVPITYLDDYAAEIDKIKVEDVMAAARHVIQPQIMSTMIVGTVPENFQPEVKALAKAGQ